jgi:hypothetical protein
MGAVAELEKNSWAGHSKNKTRKFCSKMHPRHTFTLCFMHFRNKREPGRENEKQKQFIA